MKKPEEGHPNYDSEEGMDSIMNSPIDHVLEETTVHMLKKVHSYKRELKNHHQKEDVTNNST
jgi:hypothetical protein